MWNTVWLVSFGFPCLKNGQSIGSSTYSSVNVPPDTQTHREALTNTDLASSDFLRSWVEWHTPRDELLPLPNSKNVTPDIRERITWINTIKIIAASCNKPSVAEKGFAFGYRFLLRLAETQVRLLTPNMIRKESTNNLTIFEPPENSMLWKGDMKQVPHWGVSYIRHHREKFSRPGDLTPRISAPMLWNIQLSIVIYL